MREGPEFAPVQEDLVRVAQSAPQNSGKVLTDTLRELERDGLVERHAYAEVPARVEYELTPLGHTLHEPLRALGRWAKEYIADVLAAREDFDTNGR